MGLDDTFSDARYLLGEGVEWYNLEYEQETSELMPEYARAVEDGRILYALLAAAGAPIDKFLSFNGADEIRPLIAAAVAGDTAPLTSYCDEMRANPQVNAGWPDEVYAIVIALSTLRRAFDPLRETLRPLQARLAEYRREAQRKA